VAKLIWVQTETCHANESAVAWYAYFVGAPTEQELAAVFADAALVGSCSLGPEDEGDRAEEVPSPLSAHAGLRRYFVAAAG
jgi:hypothetical protein